ncbi:hypothetical protein KEM48_005429 [Puccinia striiformis f. sp. tritici PST-130]|nr:hypothetical protein KEM48_005429 [Puccinia striiformis f. sp. tritici PST-130]
MQRVLHTSTLQVLKREIDFFGSSSLHLLRQAASAQACPAQVRYVILELIICACREPAGLELKGKEGTCRQTWCAQRSFSAAQGSA